MSMGMVNKDTAATIPAAGNTGDKVGNLAALHTTVKSDIVAAVNEVKDEMPDKTDNDAVAPEFNDKTAYSTGELVYKDGQLYKFDSDHAAGAWDSSEVSPTTVAAEFNQLKNTLTPFVLKKGTYTKLLGGIGCGNSAGSGVTANTGYYVSDDVTTITIGTDISNVFWRKYDGTDLSASRAGTRLSIDYNKEITIQHYGSDANILPANSVGIAQATCTFTLS